MINIFLCDDNEETLDSYSDKIQSIAQKHNIIISISKYYSGEELLFKMTESKVLPDIIYLDVIMKSVNGIETAKKLRKMGCIAEIIFLTDSDDYVFDSFDVFPVQYLIKSDTSSDKYEKVLLKVIQIVQQKSTERFLVDSNNEQTLIPLNLILYFETFKRKVTIHYDLVKKIEYYATLREVENQLRNKDFIRVHRSYIVNLQYISNLQKDGVTLADSTFIPIGITYYDKVKKLFFDYICNQNTEIFIGE